MHFARWTHIHFPYFPYFPYSAGGGDHGCLMLDTSKVTSKVMTCERKVNITDIST